MRWFKQKYYQTIKQNRLDHLSTNFSTNAIEFYVYVNTYFDIELKYFSSAIDTWKTIFHYRLTTGTDDEMWSHQSWHVPFLYWDTCHFYERVDKRLNFK